MLILGPTLFPHNLNQATITQDDAELYIATLYYLGYSDWRLPNEKERYRSDTIKRYTYDMNLDQIVLMYKRLQPVRGKL